MGIGLAAFGYIFMALSFRVDTPYIFVLLSQIIVGFGMGCAFSPATNSIMSSIPVDKAGVGSAMNDTTRQLGGALGIAVLGTVLNQVYISRLSELQGTLTPNMLMLSQSSVQAAHIVAATMSNANAAQSLISAADQAYVTGMNQALIVGAAVLAGASLFALRFLPSQVRRTEEVPVVSVGD
jgi:hypothetical protein